MEKYLPISAACKDAGYLAIAAHKDDVELMAIDGIIKGREGAGFAAIVLTDGGGCPRGAGYEDVSYEDMAELRTAEQKRAAEAGGYSALYLLEKASDEIKRADPALIEEIASILREFPNSKALYLHNPFDRHPTHVAACLAAIEAVRSLDEEEKPEKIYGCEVWRGLDWLPSEYKIAFDLSGYDELSRELMACFPSQNAATRYDGAVIERRRANAAFNESHECDKALSLGFAIDLTPLKNKGESVKEFAQKILSEFSRETMKLLEK